MTNHMWFFLPGPARSESSRLGYLTSKDLGRYLRRKHPAHVRLVSHALSKSISLPAVHCYTISPNETDGHKRSKTSTCFNIGDS
jgi:hypothetical protein